MQQAMLAIAIARRDTLDRVGTKSVDRRFVEHVAALVRHEVDTRYGGNQRDAARHLPISQTQISDYYTLKPGKGLGLPVLLALRSYFNRSLDELLGLDPLPSDQLTAQIKASIEAHMAGQPFPRMPAPEPRAAPAKREVVTPIAPQGQSKKAAQANTRSRSSARKQNSEADEGRRVAHASQRPAHKTGKKRA